MSMGGPNSWRVPLTDTTLSASFLTMQGMDPFAALTQPEKVSTPECLHCESLRRSAPRLTVGNPAAKRNLVNASTKVGIPGWKL